MYFHIISQTFYVLQYVYTIRQQYVRTWYSMNAKLSFGELQELQDLLRIRILLFSSVRIQIRGFNTDPDQALKMNVDS